MKSRRVFTAAHFVNTNVTAQRRQVLSSEKEHDKLPVDCTNIFKKQNMTGAKYSDLDNFGYAEISSYYSITIQYYCIDNK